MSCPKLKKRKYAMFSSPATARKNGRTKLRFIIMTLRRNVPVVCLEAEKSLIIKKLKEKRISIMRMAMKGSLNKERESSIDATEGIINAGSATYMTIFRNKDA